MCGCSACPSPICGETGPRRKIKTSSHSWFKGKCSYEYTPQRSLRSPTWKPLKAREGPFTFSGLKRPDEVSGFARNRAWAPDARHCTERRGSVTQSMRPKGFSQKWFDERPGQIGSLPGNIGRFAARKRFVRYPQSVVLTSNRDASFTGKYPCDG
jgi:hypothetical protein